LSGLDSAEQSECFYAMWGLIDTVDLMAYDFANIIANGSLNWFNVMAYDPLHFTGDFSVTSQFCGGQTQLNNLVSMASLDYAYISMFFTQSLSYLIT